MPNKSSADAIRLRENQRRSRERRKEYVADLEYRWQQCQRTGIEASVELQRVARRVVDMNNRLRELLREKGVRDDEIEAWIREEGETDGVDTVRGVVKLLGAQPCGGPPEPGGKKSSCSKSSCGDRPERKQSATGSMSSLTAPISPPSSAGACSNGMPTPPPSIAPIKPTQPIYRESVPLVPDPAAMFRGDMTSIQHSAISTPPAIPRTQRIAMDSNSLSMDAYQYPLTTTANPTSFCMPNNNSVFPAYPYNELSHFEAQGTAQHIPSLQHHAPLPPQQPIQSDTTPCDTARDLIHGFRTGSEVPADLEDRLCPQGANNDCVIDNQVLFGLLDDIGC